jgi:hypothetical protein
LDAVIIEITFLRLAVFARDQKHGLGICDSQRDDVVFLDQSNAAHTRR